MAVRSAGAAEPGRAKGLRSAATKVSLSVVVPDKPVTWVAISINAPPALMAACRLLTIKHHGVQGVWFAAAGTAQARKLVTTSILDDFNKPQPQRVLLRPAKDRAPAG